MYWIQWITKVSNNSLYLHCLVFGCKGVTLGLMFLFGLFCVLELPRTPMRTLLKRTWRLISVDVDQQIVPSALLAYSKLHCDDDCSLPNNYDTDLFTHHWSRPNIKKKVWAISLFSTKSHVFGSICANSANAQQKTKENPTKFLNRFWWKLSYFVCIEDVGFRVIIIWLACQ